MSAKAYLKDAIDFSQIQRVLVVKLQHLGDVLLTTPVFSTLKQQYPHLQIDALVYADSTALLRDNPAVSQIFSIDRNWKNQPSQQWRHEWQLLQSLKQRDHQLTINLTDRWRAVWLNRLLRSRYSVAPKFSHKRGKFWRNSFSHVYSTPSLPRHTVETNLDALRRLGCYPEASSKALSLPINSQAAQNITQHLRSAQLDQQRFVVMHPTSRWMFKAWNPAGFAQVLQLLAAQQIATVLVSGPDQKELDYVQQIRAYGAPVSLDLSGQLNLSELAALLDQASAFIGLDSVAMHMAAAVGTPCVALFGPSNDLLWGPWQVPHRVLSGQFTCRPCGQDGCGSSKISDCLQAIQPQQVLQAVQELRA